MFAFPKGTPPSSMLVKTLEVSMDLWVPGCSVVSSCTQKEHLRLSLRSPCQPAGPGAVLHHLDLVNSLWAAGVTLISSNQ